jgi:hypothetical protein
MDKCELCFVLNNMKALFAMFTRRWFILGFNGSIVCSRHNIGGKGCNYNFNNFFLSVDALPSSCIDSNVSLK